MNGLLNEWTQQPLKWIRNLASEKQNQDAIVHEWLEQSIEN